MSDEPIDPRLRELGRTLDDLMVLVHGMRQSLWNYGTLPNVNLLTRQVRAVADAELEVRGWAPGPLA